ncbi:hypothetical protein PO883_07415 [Massilia sp. DJPM01]|nr:hypothetical protein [Massilia sp. DJPM01]MDM5177026.1 hypothetical protein [Massilia sp. DJPM01]
MAPLRLCVPVAVTVAVAWPPTTTVPANRQALVVAGGLVQRQRFTG